MNQTAKPSVSWLPLILIVLAIVLAWLCTLPFSRWWIGATDLEKTGVFGDTFGAVNALFSGLAFAGLFYAILLQRAELQAQREELEATRKVLQSQKQESEKQNETLALQAFENTFFQLLRVHSDNVNSLDLRNMETNGIVIAKGRDCFKTFYAYFRNAWNNAVNMNSMDHAHNIQVAYDVFFQRHEQDVGHYFRHLYHLIKFVHENEVVDKRKYTNIVRAQLSKNELLLLYYNCLSNFGSEKFKPLVEEYTLLHTVSTEQLVHPTEHSALYKPTAFRKED
jgi:hypothetical protein